MKMDKMMDLYHTVRPMCIRESGVNAKQLNAFEESLITQDKRVFCFVGCILNQLKVVRYWKFTFKYEIIKSLNIFFFSKQIDKMGKIKKDQMMEFYQIFQDHQLNANAKTISADLFKALHKSKGICEAGRIAAKFIRTVILSN